MTAVPFTVACTLLAVDAKTLRQWIKHADLSLHPHSTDARIKCLTREQVHLLASLHGRVLQAEGSDQKPDAITSPITPASFHDPALSEKLTRLEAQVASQQAQIALLALQLLQERDQRLEQRLLNLEACLASTREPVLQPPTAKVAVTPETHRETAHSTPTRGQIIPLIQSCANGSYVLICPKEGELSLTPDTQEWFVWLASLSSFRFVGQSGRFSARRGPAPRSHHSWYAQRTIHQRSYSKYLGRSEHLTIARLEVIAATLQSYIA